MEDSDKNSSQLGRPWQTKNRCSGLAGLEVWEEAGLEEEVGLEECQEASKQKIRDCHSPSVAEFSHARKYYHS